MVVVWSETVRPEWICRNGLGDNIHSVRSTSMDNLGAYEDLLLASFGLPRLAGRACSRGLNFAIFLERVEVSQK